MDLFGSGAFRYKLDMDYDDTQTRLQVIFTGRVQGVGFRYSVCRIAASFNVTGFVRNLTDGSVEMTAEGKKPELSDFYNEIRQSPLERYMMNEQIRWLPSTGEFKQFGIL